jgi:RNA polymerase sigma factor (sigma-70 family)
MVEKLAVNHKQWINYALKVCGNLDDANDLVQDMYLKMHTIDKEVNSSYIYCVIKNIYLDQYRKNKVREKTIFIQEELEEQNEDIDLTIAYDEALNELKTYKQLIVNFSTKDGVNNFAKESGISRATVIRIRNEFKAILWQKVKGLEM